MGRTPVVLVFVFLGSLAMTGQEVTRAQDGAADSAPRTWTTRVGGYTTEATFLKFEDGVVQLRKDDGSIVSVPIERLIAADQRFVRQRASAAKTHEDAAPKEPGDGGETSDLMVSCRQLCEEITKGYKGKDSSGKATIAVVEFSDLSGGVTDFGRLLSEELVTKLFATGKYKVIERLLLNKAIAEHKLQLQGLIDPKSAKELGKILGVDAIVSGTIADLGDSLRVNARLISTETGEVFSVAAATIVKDDTITGLMTGGGKPARPGSGGSSSPSHTKGQPVQLPFREDFSGYKEDDRTDWGDGAKVRVGADGRKWLVPAANGQQTIGLDVELPVNAYIEFEYEVQCLESGKRNNKVLSGLCLIDETGAKYRIEWTIDDEMFFIGGWNNTMTLPGGAREKSQAGAEGVGTIRILKRGDKIEVDPGAKYASTYGRHVLNGNVSDFKKFTRFEMDLYKGSNTIMSVTNIKVGSLDARDGAGTDHKVPLPRKVPKRRY